MSEDEEDALRYPRIGKPPSPEWLAERKAYRAAHPLIDDEAQPPPEGTALSDDDMRHHSAARLFDQLESITNLARHCEHMASIPSNDRIAPVYAAARLLNATAHVAKALGTLTLTERRIRRIIEVAQPSVPQNAHSNLTLDAGADGGVQNEPDLSRQAAAALDGVLFDTLQRKMLLYMNLVAAERFDPELKKAYPEAFAPGGALADAPKA